MSVSPGPTIEERVRATIIRVLGTHSADLSVPLRMGSTPGWDSMGHMALVIELEKEFQISFPAYRLPELVDISSIVKAVQDSGAK